MNHLPIPEQWSPAQALTTVAFLESLISAIWQRHGKAMARHQQHIRLLADLCDLSDDPSPDNDLDDEIPF